MEDVIEVPRFVRGRVLREAGGGLDGVEVFVRVGGDPPVSLPPVVPQADGRFEIEVAVEDLEEAGDGPLALVVTDPLAPDLTLNLGEGAFEEEIVVVLPERREDPRTRVETVRRLLEAEREATGSARVMLAEEVGRRDADENRVRRVVTAILGRLTGSSGGDTRFKAVSGRSVSSLTREAVRAGREDVSAAPPAVAVRPGLYDDGARMRSGDLIADLAGARQPRDGYWRADPLERLRLRRRHVGPDGLPLSRRSDPAGGNDGRTGGEGDGGPAGNRLDGEAEAIGNAVSEKVERLVDAMRLPEDPPLLTADSAVKGAGPEVEFARGIADTTAFHDFHELIPALPDVWQEVFDRRFVSVVETAVRELDAAGVPIDDLAGDVEDAAPGGTGPVELLAERLASLGGVYDTSAVAEVRPRTPSMLTPASAIGSGMASASARVLLRSREVAARDQGGVGGGGTQGGSTGAEFEGQIVQTEQDLEVTGRGERIPSLLEELRSFLRGEHSFTVFAADGKDRAINFGVLLTWRHEMEPLAYQVGEIAHTMTLAPGEERKIVTKRRRSVKRSTAESEKALRSLRTETTDTMRAESEILRKATASTDFHLSSSGSTNVLVQGGDFQTNSTRKVGRDGNDTRRRFREAVVKAAQEVRNERSMEVKEESEELFEEETTARVKNSNEEIAMTAVFYTLQRRYRLRERLHRARPVILVALPVPDPAEITTAWLVRYAWVLRRCLLDDRLIEALDYLTSAYLGDQETLVHLERAVAKHERALDAAEHRLRSARALSESRSGALSTLRRSLSARESESLLDQVLDAPGVNLVADVNRFARNLFGGGGQDDEQAERERRALALEAAEEDLARAERAAREAEAQVAGASNALQEATRDLVAAKSRTLNYEVRIAELRVHVCDQLPFYMQCIWANQPPDRRYFELHDVLVPVLSDEVRVTRVGTFDEPGLDGITPDRFRVDFAEDDGPIELRSLAEMCNLHELLGIWGNLAMFPLKEGNVLTDLILAPYVDGHEVLRDPEDVAASWTLSELEEYADELREDPEEFERQEPFLRATLERLLTAPRLSEEEIVVPTDSLYVDLLTSGGSLLEPFKREHRALDVEVVREELRTSKIESARRAARIAEGDLADPDMDDFARHLVRGDGSALPPPRP